MNTFIERFYIKENLFWDFNGIGEIESELKANEMDVDLKLKITFN